MYIPGLCNTDLTNVLAGLTNKVGEMKTNTESKYVKLKSYCSSYQEN